MCVLKRFVLSLEIGGLLTMPSIVVCGRRRACVRYEAWWAIYWLAAAAVVVIVTSARSLTQLYTRRPLICKLPATNAVSVFFLICCRRSPSWLPPLINVNCDMTIRVIPADSHAHGNGHLYFNKTCLNHNYSCGQPSNTLSSVLGLLSLF